MSAALRKDRLMEGDPEGRITTSRLGGPGTAFRVIRDPGFAPYFVGNALSATGWWFQTLAAQLLVWRQTHSGLLLGVLSFAEFLPLLVLSPWAGSIADRFDRRRIVLVTQLLSVALSGGLALLTWAELAPTPVVIVDAFLLGLTNAFASPAALALIPSLVPREALAAAVGLNSMTWNLARAVGPALAAVTVSSLGIAAAFGINAASFLALVAGMLMVKPRAQARSTSTRALRDSIRLVRENPRLLVFLGIVAVVGIAADPINTLGPAFAHAFGQPDTRAGLIIGIFGAGAVCAALVLTGRNAGSDRRAAITLASMATGLAVFSVLPSLAWALPLLFIGGLGYLASNTSATSQLQLSVAEHERGRVMALWNVAFLGLRPVASLTDGAIASGFGVRAAGVTMQIPALAAAVLLVVWISRRTHAQVGSQGSGYSARDA
jgi:MFS family permease